MKKIAILITMVIFICFSVACSSNIENKNGESKITLQYENPTAITSESNESGITTKVNIEETTETTVGTTETEKENTTTVGTTEITVATVQTTTVETKIQQTTVAATTPAPVVTTTVPKIIIPQTPTSNYNALNFPIQKAMWISYLEFQNILKGKTKAQFTASVQEMYNNCKDLGINTVYVHARSHSDAYYKSDLFPWSKNVTGIIGAVPSFDPYQILVDEAHNRGLSIHAWINPLRGVTDEDIQKVSDSYAIKKWYNNSSTRGIYVVNVDGTWYCNPAYKEVRDLINGGVKEIISKYNVDGIHIDDYFYPTTQTYFDEAAFKASGSANRNQWRLDTISNMIKEMYSAVKSVNSTVLFGVSPQGNINNNYDYQYADVRKWCSSSGYLDYIVPQIYFGFKNSSQPYSTNLQSWCDMVKNSNVKLIVGLAAYKIGSTESTGEWANDSNIISRQIETFRSNSKYGGVALFRYDSIYAPMQSVATKVYAERESIKQEFSK